MTTKGKPIRQLIIEVVLGVLQTIRTPTYRTDIGKNVFLGRTKIDPNTELPCILVWPQNESATREAYGAYTRIFELKTVAVARAGIDVESMAGDIFEAIMGGNILYAQSLKYTGGGVTDYPEIGESIIGVSLSFEITYQTGLSKADL